MPVEPVKNQREINLQRFRAVLSVLFWLCTVLTVASLIFDIGFKTAMTGAATLILRLVRQSAGEMSESKG
jgi:hypothetical protein